MLSTLKRLTLATAALAFAVQAAAAELTLDVYNPGEAAIFPVSSVLVSGAKDAILVDAQFGKSQAEHLVQKIRASGKHLTTIYISHGDPDYYFGLDTLTAAFPDAKVLAPASGGRPHQRHRRRQTGVLGSENGRRQARQNHRAAGARRPPPDA
jgi:glyoxylase-like metal-dependent hydrolase (beta-lactamase superfamily II)